MVLSAIGYSIVFGKPLVFWIGISVITGLFATAVIGFLNSKGNRAVPFKWHPWLAALTLILAAAHAALALLFYL
ncbi:MAG: hypothetical protein Q7R70_01685 [Candidatus Diapherotrites archaeon]|nr:hypothetical protein [Candidatus Diapherotrites archaeon]